jgi:adenosylmethionine-8-amino-7-oxononanoate aminotransferase
VHARANGNLQRMPRDFVHESGHGAPLNSHGRAVDQQRPALRDSSGFACRTSRDEWAVQCAKALATTIHYEGPQIVAALIVTPHGAFPDYGLVPPQSYWRTIRDICDRYDVLLIADEDVTAFGRTGVWLAMEHFDVTPDIITMAKGISSVCVPFDAVAVSEAINQSFEEGRSYFIQGFTNGGIRWRVLRAGKSSTSFVTRTCS